MWEEELGLFLISCSVTICMTVGASRVKLLSTTAASAKLSALSLPVTQAWPGVNTHTILSKVPCEMIGIQSA